MRRNVTAAAVAAMIMAPAPAAAKTPASGSDLKAERCVVALASFPDSANASEADKAAFQGMMFFFIGKLVGRHSTAEVNPMIEAVKGQVAEANLQPVAEACIKAFGEQAKVR